MATLANFRTRVSSKVGLDPTAGGADELAIDGWVNEAVTDILMRTKCYVTSGTISMVAGTKDYTLATSILYLVDVYVTASSVDYQLERVSIDDLLIMRRASTANVSPAQYYSVQGGNLLMIYPTPASSADTITYYGVPRPSVLSVSSDDPSTASYGIPAEWHKAIEYYALAQAGDYDDDDSSQNGATYMQLYELWIKRMKKAIALHGHHRLPRARVVTPARRPFIHDRSTYPVVWD